MRATKVAISMFSVTVPSVTSVTTDKCNKCDKCAKCNKCNKCNNLPEQLYSTHDADCVETKPHFEQVKILVCQPVQHTTWIVHNILIHNNMIVKNFRLFKLLFSPPCPPSSSPPTPFLPLPRLLTAPAPPPLSTSPSPLPSAPLPLLTVHHCLSEGRNVLGEPNLAKPRQHPAVTRQFTRVVLFSCMLESGCD